MWMIKEFSFKNVGPFEEETKLELIASLNDEEKKLIRLETFDRKILKFNKAIGIFGPNASGKTKILETILFYLHYNSLETNSRLFIDFFHSINNKEKDFFVKAVITNGKEEIHHQIKFNSKDFFKATDQELLNSINIRNSFSESINLINLKTNEIQEVFNNANEKLNLTKNKYKFIDWFNFNIDINAIENLNKRNHYVHGDIERKENERKIYEALNEVCQLGIKKTYFLKQNYDFDSMDPRQFGYLINKLKNKGFSESRLAKYLTDIARICDPNIESIKITSHQMSSGLSINLQKINQEFIYYFFVKFFENNWEHSFNNLSSGILNLFIVFLELLYLNSSVKGHNLIVVDELGQSWHAGMTINFINFLLDSNILNQSTLIFTSHQPEIGNFLRKDAVWIIDRNHYLNPFFTFKNPVTKASISRQIFSKVYYDDIFDVFQTNPFIADFIDSNVDGYFEKEGS